MGLANLEKKHIVVLLAAIAASSAIVTFVLVAWHLRPSPSEALARALRSIESTRGWNYSEKIVMFYGGKDRAFIEGSVDLVNKRILSRIARIPERDNPELIVFYRDSENIYANIGGSWIRVGEGGWSVEDTILYKVLRRLESVSGLEAGSSEINGTPVVVVYMSSSDSEKFRDIYSSFTQIVAPKKAPPPYNRAEIRLYLSRDGLEPVGFELAFYKDEEKVLHVTYMVSGFNSEFSIKPPDIGTEKH